jgi:hypothetical protein
MDNQLFFRYFELESITYTLKKVLENKDIQTAIAQFHEFSRTNKISKLFTNLAIHQLLGQKQRHEFEK